MTESREVAVRSGLKRELANNTTQQKPRAEQQKFLRGREPGPLGVISTCQAQV